MSEAQSMPVSVTQSLAATEIRLARIHTGRFSVTAICGFTRAKSQNQAGGLAERTVNDQSL